MFVSRYNLACSGRAPVIVVSPGCRPDDDYCWIMRCLVLLEKQQRIYPLWGMDSMKAQGDRFVSRIFHPSGEFPNNERLPLVILKSPLKDAPTGPELFEATFRENGWPPAWRNGLYAFHHYHSKAHEVLGIYAGWARVCFGGPQGEILEAEKGDVIIIPAGVSHCNRGESPDFKVVGGYPDGQSWDMMYGKPGERVQAEHNISKVFMPACDPVFGPEGILVSLWGCS